MGQTLANWTKAHRAGRLRGSGRGVELTPEQMEIRRLRAELARVNMERRVVGWSLQPHVERSLVIDALRMAWQRGGQPGGELLFHSDRGRQYASHDFTRPLDEHGITASMSRRGNCRDNACWETLFGSMKVEWARRPTFRDFGL